jgi:hypothetical protein
MQPTTFLSSVCVLLAFSGPAAADPPRARTAQESRVYVDWTGGPTGRPEGVRSYEMRSPAMMVIGIVAALGGAVALGYGAFSSICIFDCGDKPTPAALGAMIGGGIGIAAGIPLAIVGAQDVPVGTAASYRSWIGAPAARGWQWRF